MFLIQKIAEEKIQAAIERGEFDDLPGKGKPLVLDDTSFVPEELRAGFRLLKNSGYLPPEMELRKEIGEVEALLQHVNTESEECNLVARLNLLRNRLLTCGHDTALVTAEGQYREKILHKLGQ